LVEDFLETGAGKGEVTFYVTIDPGTAKLFAEEFSSNFHLFVCNPQAAAIVEDLPNVLKLKGVENLTDVSMALTSAIRKLNTPMKDPRRICLGLVSDVLLQHHAVQTRRWLTSLLAELKSTGFTTLAVIDLQMHSSEELHAILGLFEGEINIFEKETDEGLRKYLRIKKMGNSKYLEDELPLSRARLEMVPKVKLQESTIGQVVLDKHRIAVLPFVNMSPDPNDEYFADGMTEEIISTVSGISGLDVISRTSVMRYKKTEKAVKEIGRELEVGSLLEGSFRKAGNKIRVTAQLIDVAADRHVWAQNYDRNLDDIFVVQSDVARQVAEALRVQILSAEKERIEKKPTESVTAYSLYLRGRYYWNKRTLQDLKKAMEYFELAVHEDPSFALGYVGQADCAVVLRGTWRIDLEENLAKAKAMAERALQLDFGIAEAHTTKGLLLAQEYNLREAEEEYKKAIDLKPSYATAHHWYYLALYYQLRWDEAQVQIEKAIELDPMSPIINANYGDFFYHSKKDYGKALEFYRRSVELGYEGAHSSMANMFGKMKKYDDMRREGAIRTAQVKDAFPMVEKAWELIYAFYEEDKERVRRLLPEIEAHSVRETRIDSYDMAGFHFYLGEVDKGFECLERAYSEKLPTLAGIQCDELLDGIRTDPRYLDLLKRLGLGQTAQPTS
jgi:TolB-like protein/tetratricopeptide (TPR) repeat protein/KaiC/GvpD/RAD55 family RecA-like ATPase